MEIPTIKTRITNLVWTLLTSITFTLLVYVSTSFASIKSDSYKGKCAYEDNKTQQEDIESLIGRCNAQSIINTEFKKDIDHMRDLVEITNKNVELLLQIELRKKNGTY